MSPPKPKLIAGLAALGLSWTSATLAVAQEAAPTNPAPTPVKAPSNTPTFAVLLLSNGREIQGNVSEDKTGANFILHSKSGTIPLPKREVEKRFASMADLYQYKVARLPDRDPDERMKLARWCLEKKMNGEARGHLKSLLEINPNDNVAERMIASLDAATERGDGGRDTAVRVTGAEVVDSAPRELNPAALPRPRGPMGRALEQPVIFDLPPDLASKRATEFARYVHPVLQQACASCHHQSYRGDFQLIPAKSRREWTTEVVRSNLDVALRHVDRNEPSQSDLLTFALSPHGPNTRPILHGPNDPRYRTLATWVTGLRASEPTPRFNPAPVPTVAPTTSPAAANAEQFGSERFLPGPSTPRGPASPPSLGRSTPSGKNMVELYQAEATHPSMPPNTSFAPPSLAGAPRPGALPRVPNTKPTPTGPPLPLNPIAPTPMPGANAATNPPPGGPTPPPDDVIPPTNRTKKSTKLDRDLLEKVLKSRQQSPPPQP